MTEPTDEELDSVLCHHWPAFSMQAVLVQMWLRDAMRAALAKWGTPQPVVRESSEDLYWELHGLSKILEGSGLIDESRNPDAYTTILDAMAFVRWAQPVVREPQWIDPNNKTQQQYLPHIGEPVLFCHKGTTYYGKHTGASFVSGVGFAQKHFNTWNCHWMYPPAAHGITQKGGA